MNQRKKQPQIQVSKLESKSKICIFLFLFCVLKNVCKRLCLFLYNKLKFFDLKNLFNSRDLVLDFKSFEIIQNNNKNNKQNWL